MNGIDYARGLRLIADWYEAHPDIPVPHIEEIGVYGVEETREEAARIAEALKPCRKEWDKDFFKLVRDFGPIKLKFVFMRKAVCTQRVVKRLVEVIEWDCDSSLLTEGAEEEATA